MKARCDSNCTYSDCIKHTCADYKGYPPGPVNRSTYQVGMAKSDQTDKPNGFTTERMVDGERRCVRHYNDGRVSSRDHSRMSSSASVTRCKVIPGAPLQSTSRPTSQSSKLSNAGTVDSPADAEEVEIPKDLPVEKYHNTSDVKPAFREQASQTVRSTSQPASNSNTGDRSCVLERVANIETQLDRLEKRRLVRTPEERKSGNL